MSTVRKCLTIALVEVIILAAGKLASMMFPDLSPQILIAVIVIALIAIIVIWTWPMHLPQRGREEGRAFAKGLHKLLDEIEGQIESWETIVPANHPFKNALVNSIGEPVVANLRSELVHTIEEIGDTLNMQNPKKFRRIEVAFRRYTHPWRSEEDCLDIEFFKQTEELERYGRKEMMQMPVFYDPPQEGCSPRVLKRRLVELRDKINDEFGSLLRAYPVD